MYDTYAEAYKCLPLGAEYRIKHVRTVVDEHGLLCALERLPNYYTAEQRSWESVLKQKFLQYLKYIKAPKAQRKFVESHATLREAWELCPHVEWYVCLFRSFELDMTHLSPHDTAGTWAEWADTIQNVTNIRTALTYDTMLDVFLHAREWFVHKRPKGEEFEE